MLDSQKESRAPQTLSVIIGDERWNFDTREEFLAEYLRADGYHFDHIAQDNRLFILSAGKNSVDIHVEFPSRQEIERIFQVFEQNLHQSTVVVEPRSPKIFIGHGHDLQWRDLKDHLREQHGLNVIAYEIGPRAGLSVKEVLEKMLDDSSFALLVLTGEDLHVDGEIHARENVIHELGLFQGRLGFRRAIAIIEEGVKEFSNILGVNQVRFPRNRIKETFGDIVATIRREFESQ